MTVTITRTYNPEAVQRVEKSSQKRAKPQPGDLLANGTSYYAATTRSTAITVDSVFKDPSKPSTSEDGYSLDMDNHLRLAFMRVDYGGATNRALLKIKDEKFNLGIFLAEGPKTLRFLADSVKLMLEAYKAVKRGDLRRLRELAAAAHKKHGKKRLASLSLDKIASSWMLFRYAIMPIVYDMQGVIAEYNRIPDDYHKVYRVSSGELIHWDDAPRSYGAQIGQVALSSVTKTRVTLYYRITANRINSRLGMVNLLSVLWEVTPLSFVVDWIIPIGDAIAGLDANYGVEFLAGYQSSRIDVRVASWPSFSFEDAHAHRSVLTDIAANESWARGYSRSKLTTMPLPSLIVSPSMNMKRYLDSLALLKLLFLRTGELPKKAHKQYFRKPRKLKNPVYFN